MLKVRSRHVFFFSFLCSYSKFLTRKAAVAPRFKCCSSTWKQQPLHRLARRRARGHNGHGTAPQASEQAALPYAGARARAQPLLLQAKPDIAAPASGHAAVAAPPLRHEGVAPPLLQRRADEQTQPRRDRAQAIAVAYLRTKLMPSLRRPASVRCRRPAASAQSKPLRREHEHRLNHLRRCK
jgi:hypothetical protein